jgi:hypothetical protein
MSLWTTLISPITNLVTSWNDGRIRIKEAKINVELAKYNAEAEKWKSAHQAETNWDLEALRASKTSWKDEFLTLVLTAPFVGSFIPGVQDQVAEGWKHVAEAPEWYQASFIGIIAASFGLRWMFNRKLVKK